MRGDELKSLIRTYSPELLRTAKRITRSDLEAEEVVQDVWVAVWSSPENLPAERALRSWLHGVTCNLAKSRTRRLANRQRLTEVRGESPPTNAEQVAVEVTLLLDEVWTYIHDLPEMQMRVVTCRVLDGLSVKETAEVLGRAPGTVKATLNHALSKVKAEFGDSVFDALNQVKGAN